MPDHNILDWATLGRAERDAAYDNIAAVPDSAALNAARASAWAIRWSAPASPFPVSSNSDRYATRC